MLIDVSYKENIPVVKISGELDMYDSTKIESVFNSVSEESDVIIDCSEISFVDSTIIGLFVRYSLDKGKNSKKVVLVNVKTFFIQLLELAKLTKLFEVVGTIDEYFTNINN